MALDFLALVAFVSIVVGELCVGHQLPERLCYLGLRPNDHTKVAVLSICFASFLLVLAGYVIYFLMAVALCGLGVALVVLNKCSDDFRMSSWGNFGYRLIAGAGHVVGVWFLPYAVIYSLSGALHEPRWVSQEVGHVIPTTLLYVSLVVLPLLMMPPNFEQATLEHQIYESRWYFVFGVFNWVMFRSAHHLDGEDAREGIMSAPNWDHELLGIVWGFSGLAGLLFAMQGKKTSIHIAFPAIWTCIAMLGHAGGNRDDMTMDEMNTWMKMHHLHGMAFGAGALCRLLNKQTEAVFMFFLGVFIFPTSAQFVNKYLVKVFYNDYFDPYPITNVIMLVTVSAGVFMFPIHLATLTSLRKRMDEMAPSLGFTQICQQEDCSGTEDDSDSIPEEELEERTMLPQTKADVV